MPGPTIAAVIATYNAEHTLTESVASVLASTVPVALFIVDDASHTPVTLKDLPSRQGYPITLLRNATNLGPAATRNRGIEAVMAQGYTYIAVQDSDDISAPTRFAKQAQYLDAHPQTAIVGTWGHAIDEHSKAVLSTTRVPTSPEILHKTLWLDCNFVAASVMFRASALAQTGLYDASLRNCEDYELFFRLAKRFQLGNIPEPLLNFRLCAGGISLATLRRQRLYRLRVQTRHFRPLLWQSWAGILKSLIRLAIPTKVVETAKKYRNRTKSA